MGDKLDQGLLAGTRPSLTLYSAPASIHAQYARVALLDICAQYTTKDVELPLENLGPEIARINPKMSIPFLVVHAGGEEQKVLTESRDIAMFATTLPGGRQLVPKGTEEAIQRILDQIYGANGGQLSFKSYQHRYPLFRTGLKLVGRLRLRTIRKFRNDPANGDLASVYDSKLLNVGAPDVPLEEQVAKARSVAGFLDRALEASGDTWLTGPEHSVADCLAAVWLQWVLWSESSVPVSERCLRFLDRAKARPSWTATMTGPNFAPSFVLARLRLGFCILCTLVLAICVGLAAAGGVI